jgi:hypothetical protein
LLPGEVATSANFTNYDKGINGIMVDIEGLTNPTAVGDGDFSEFEFKVGNDNHPPAWPTAAEPGDVDVRDLGGGVDRVSFFWAANAIPTRNWLQVTMKAGDATGLAEDDVFYFGNAVGDANLDGATLYEDIFAIYGGVDLDAAVPITEPLDIDRDGQILYDDIHACYAQVADGERLEMIADIDPDVHLWNTEHVTVGPDMVDRVWVDGVPYSQQQLVTISWTAWLDAHQRSEKAKREREEAFDDWLEQTGRGR